MDLRCDDRMDCLDESDERLCSLVQDLGPGYKKEKPPPSKRGEKVTVNASITLNTIFDIKEIDMSIKLGFNLLLIWNDPRITFNNLREDKHTNILPDTKSESIWLLGLLFQNSFDNAKVSFDEDSLVYVTRQVQGEQKNKFSMPRDLVYHGSMNPINFERSYELPFKCSFKLNMYPFDKQMCEIVLQVPRNLQAYVGIQGESFTYAGRVDLVQFTVSNWNLIQSNDSFLVATFTLERNVLYHIAATFLPTTSLVIIAESTLFISETHFEANIMVALTAKLVTYTFYQSIGATLPQTSYLKMIDAWLLFVMMMPFFVFLHLALLQIYILMDKNKEPSQVLKSAQAWEEAKSRKIQEEKKKTVWKTVSLMAIISFSFLFVICFFAIAAFM